MKRKYFVFCASSSYDAFKKRPVRTLYIRSEKTNLLFLNFICYASVLNAAVFCPVEVGSTIALHLERRLQNDIQFNFDNCLQKRVSGKLLTLGCTEWLKWVLMPSSPAPPPPFTYLFKRSLHIFFEFFKF